MQTKKINVSEFNQDVKSSECCNLAINRPFLYMIA